VKTYLDPSDVVRLEAAAACLRDRLLIRLLFHLGCRISEVLAIGREDIDLDAGTVTILHLKTRVHLACPSCQASLSKAHRYCPKCGGAVGETVKREKEHRRVRTLPLDAASLELLYDHIRRNGPVKKNGIRLIFGINRHRAWQIVAECARRAGLPSLANPETGEKRGVSPHRLRDAFAVHAAKLDDSGDGLRLLQEHLGHASFNTTARYRKVAGEEHREWYDRLWRSEGPGQPNA